MFTPFSTIAPPGSFRDSSATAVAEPACAHDWCDSPYILCSNPPQRDRICRKCGRVERVTTGPYYDAGEFDRLKGQFAGKEAR